MKMLFALVSLMLFIPLFSLAQTTETFHEDFELPGLDDSVFNSSTPTTGYAFAINTRLHSGSTSLRSDSCQVKMNNTVYLTSQTFSTLGSPSIILSFNQICKIDFLDVATIEVSSNNGANWTQLTGTQYQGTGQYAQNGNKFACHSYGASWAPSTPSALPLNTWWKAETFDVSTLLANTASAKIRFRLTDGGAVGPNNNKGWYLDNIKVTVASSEFIPPSIVLLSPLLTGNIFSSGPFPVKAKITDASGIDTAYVVYTVNNGPNDTAGMNHLSADTLQAMLPMMNDSDQVCWYVVAIDNAPAHNVAMNPVSSCNSFLVITGLTLPYYNNFDGSASMWVPSYGGTNQNSSWQLGTPAFGQTNSPHSPPDSWDVNLTTAYNINANCILTSPMFNFTGVENAILRFWINYYTYLYSVGTRLEYSLNGSDWSVLGSENDSLGINWYTGDIFYLGIPCWTGNSSGWQESIYSLSAFNNYNGPVQFRFVFTSDETSIGFHSGVSIDDFMIYGATSHDVSLSGITAPVSGCGLSQENVTINVHNNGTDDVTTGLTANYQLGNGPVITEAVPDPIGSGDTLTFTFSAPVDLSVTDADSTFSIRAWVHLTGDPNPFLDTLTVTVMSKHLPPAPASGNAFIPYGTSVTLTATSADTVFWYSALTGGQLLATGPTYVSPLLYETTVFYLSVTGTNGCANWSTDTVYISQPSAVDGAVLALISPVSGINLSDSLILSASIKNYGFQAFTDFFLSYSIDGQPPVTESFSQLLLTGNTATCSFTLPADLSTFGSYAIRVWIAVPGDTVVTNDTAFAEIVNSMYTWCLSSATSTNDDDIGNVSISTLNNGNAFPSLNNPSSVNTYTDFTTLNPAPLHKGLTYPVSVSQITQLSFYPCCIKVFIDWDYSGTFEEATETAFSAGPTSSSNMTLTGSIAVPLWAHEGHTRLRVVLREGVLQSEVHACGTYSYGETEDYTCLVLPIPPFDASVSQVISPGAAYEQGSSLAPSIVVKNNGQNTITAATVYYCIDNQSPLAFFWNGTLPSMAADTLILPASVFPSGTHIVKTWIEVSGDLYHPNDTLTKTITGVSSTPVPYTDHFDSVPVRFTAQNISGSNWVHGAADNSVFPFTAVSSPHVWAVGLGTGTYQDNTECSLVTQDFNLSGQVPVELSFWRNNNTQADADGMYVQYSPDGGITWFQLGGLNDSLGENWYDNTLVATGTPAFTGNSGGWVKSVYLLSDFSNVTLLKFRFVFISNSSSHLQGFALDNFRIGPHPLLDAGITNITSPGTNYMTGVAYPVSLILENFGLNPLTQADVTYQLDTLPPVTQTWTGSLNHNATATVTFPSVTLTGMAHTLTAYTTLPGDAIPDNDTTKLHYPCKLFVSNTLTPQQWVQDVLVEPGTTVSNVTYTGSALAAGTFTSCSPDMGISSGLLLTSGSISNAPGPNNTSSSGTDNGTTSGDSDLMLLSGGTTHDAAVLEFDFVPQTHLVKFRYVFASEEYHEFSNSNYRDYCAFFLSGPGLNGPFSNNAENIAVVPGTSTMVSINSINNGLANMGPCMNCEYLRDNTGGPGIQYDAFTQVLTASHEVIPCQVYHVKIAVADAGDHTYDSGIFLEGAALTNDDFQVQTSYISPGNPSFTAPFTIEGCRNAEVIFTRNSAVHDTSFILVDSIYGTAVNGIDYTLLSDTVLFLPDQNTAKLVIEPLYDNIPEGNEIVYIHITSPDCEGTDTTLAITIRDYNPIELNMMPDVVLNPGQTQLMLWVNPSGGAFPYSCVWSPAVTLDNPFSLTPMATPAESGWYYVEISDSTGCFVVRDSVYVNLTGCAYVEGVLSYDNTAGTPLANTQVLLKQNNVTVADTLSQASGFYHLSEICNPGVSTVAVSCTKPWGGGNAVDALLIMKHFVGQSILAPFRLQAADVDASSLANAVDALFIMKRFVGMISGFPSGDWLFEDGTINIPQAGFVNKDIRGLCFGDVDASNVMLAKEGPSVEFINSGFLQTEPGQEFDLPVYSDRTRDIRALSLIIGYNAKEISILDINPNPKLLTDDLSPFLFKITESEIRIAWAKPGETGLAEGDTLFTLRVLLHQAVNPLLSISGNSSLADDHAQVIEKAKLLLPAIMTLNKDIHLSVYPNPSNDRFTISYLLPSSGELCLAVMNTLGEKKILKETSKETAGIHEFSLDISAFEPGMYILMAELNKRGTHLYKTLKIIRNP